MAKKTKKTTTRKKGAASKAPAEADLQRPAAEVLYAAELAALAARDADQDKPPGWRLSPKAVLEFVIGNPDADVAPKFVGRRAQIERCIVALATNRGLMLIGEPGTAKSYLSELLSAAISGDSTQVIQGSAGTTEDSIKYGWNYALLLAEGPSERSLIPAPLFSGMQQGQLVRFEEITRCPLEVQDILLSILSDRVMKIPELAGADSALFARRGFNVIATANTRDRGVNEMSAALKRRFNFETIHPIADLRKEMALVQRETDRLLDRAGVPLRLVPELTGLLVTTFHELRRGQTEGGKSLEPPSTVMSTAEAVSVAYAAGMQAHYFGAKQIEARHVVTNILGSALKDEPDDLKKLRHYFNHVVKSRKGGLWPAFYAARHDLG